jgi:hypothetical protein
MKISNQEMHQVIKDAFENYGYIDLDTTEPKDEGLLRFMKDHFIIRKYLGTGTQAGWDYRYYGVRIWLLQMGKEFWGDNFKNYFKILIFSKSSHT